MAARQPGRSQARDRTLQTARRLSDASKREIGKRNEDGGIPQDATDAQDRNPVVAANRSVNKEPRESFSGDASLERR